MREQFNSELQQSLFHSNSADDFLSGLSRAYTLAGDDLDHTVSHMGPKERYEWHRSDGRGAYDKSRATFLRAHDGAEFRVTVERIDAR